MVGTTLAQYQILQKLGEGGMGVVYKAEDAKLKRMVALKFLTVNYLKEEAAAKERFLREAQAAAALDHPHICTVYEINEVAGRIFIAMPLIEGRTLLQEIGEGPRNVAEVIEIGCQIASGLAAAHAKGVVHRDIKSSNIMVTRSNPEGVLRSQLVDFGLALLSSGGSRLSEVGITLGTLAYMSPEQALGKDTDARTDIWSLGVVLYEALTGELPFHQEYNHAVLYAIVNEQPRPVRELRPGVPIELERIIQRALEKNPDGRYAHSYDMLADLRALRRSPDLTAAIRLTKALREQLVPSIAVLPFLNMSPDEESEFLSDGITEDLINALTKVKDLQVVARNSVFQLKGKNCTPQEVGERLGATEILEGSVRRIGNRLRVIARLISVIEGCQVWSERYDRVLDDIFDIQDEISRAIVDKLKLRLADKSRAHLVRRSTENLEAYSLYLKGRFYREKLQFGKAISCFESARTEDPDFAEPYAGLAATYAFLSNLGGGPPRDLMPKAKTEALRALEIDPGLAEAHFALGSVQHWYDWDWAGAESSYQQAIALNPSDVSAHLEYSVFMAYLGRLDGAVSESKRAVELDPISLHANRYLGYVYYVGRRYHQALDQFLKAVELDPSFFPLYWHLGLVYMATGEREKAFQAFEQGRSLAGGDPLSESLAGWAYGLSGNHQEAQRILVDAHERRKQRYFSGLLLAMLHSGLGERDQAFEWLEVGYQERDGLLLTLNVDPAHDALRSDARFSNLLHRIGF